MLRVIREFTRNSRLTYKQLKIFNKSLKNALHLLNWFKKLVFNML